MAIFILLSMGLLEIVDKMSKEEGFEGAELCDSSSFISLWGINKDEPKKILLNPVILDYERMIMENPQFLDGFLHGILHEDGHRKFKGKRKTINYKEEKFCDRYANEQLKRRGKDHIEALAYVLALGSLATPECLHYKNSIRYGIFNLSLGYFERRKAVKLFEQIMKNLVSKYSGTLPGTITQVYS